MKNTIERAEKYLDTHKHCSANRGDCGVPKPIIRALLTELKETQKRNVLLKRKVFCAEQYEADTGKDMREIKAKLERANKVVDAIHCEIDDDLTLGYHQYIAGVVAAYKEDK